MSSSFQGRRLQHPPSLDWVCGSGYWDGLQLPLPRSDRLHHRHHGADLQGSERQVRRRVQRCCVTINWLRTRSSVSPFMVLPEHKSLILTEAILKELTPGAFWNSRMCLYCLLVVWRLQNPVKTSRVELIHVESEFWRVFQCHLPGNLLLYVSC